MRVRELKQTVIMGAVGALAGSHPMRVRELKQSRYDREMAYAEVAPHAGA